MIEYLGIKLTDAITWLLVAFGWYLSYKIGEKVATDAQQKSRKVSQHIHLKEILETKLSNIHETAIHYWLIPGDHPDSNRLGVLLQSSLEDLESFAESNDFDITGEITKLNMVLTGGDFQSPERPSHEQRSSIIC